MSDKKHWVVTPDEINEESEINDDTEITQKYIARTQPELDGLIVVEVGDVRDYDLSDTS